MSPAVRAFYGALVGALSVLLIHPYSRPYLLQGVWFLGDSHFLRSTTALADNIETLPEPRSLEDASLWVVTACERELAGKKLTNKQAILMVEVVQAAAEIDPDNAFWKQSEAVFQRRLGNDEAAVEAWTRASIASRWNDYQNKRLEAVLEGLEREAGRNIAWHYSIVEARKSAAAQRAALLFARQILRGDRVDDFDLRLATLRNGRLVRDGSKSVEGALMGTETIELAAYCSSTDAWGLHGVGGPITPRMLINAREEFVRMAFYSGPQVESEIKDAFREDDAREAFLNVAVIDENRHNLMMGSVLTAALPGALVSIGILGAAVYLLGHFVTVSKRIQTFFELPWVLIAGAVGAGGVYWATGLFFPSLWAALLLWSFGPRLGNQRQAAPRGLGSAYVVTIVALAIGFSTVLAYYFVARSLPGQYVLGGSAGLSLTDSSVLALAVIVASLVLFTAPVWGFIARIPASALVGRSLSGFGASLCLGCFALGVVLVPVAIGIDRSVGNSLSKSFQNEPSFYLTQ